MTNERAAAPASRERALRPRVVLIIAGAVGLAVILGVGLRLSRTDFAANAWLATALILLVDGLVATHLLLGNGVKAIRRGALISVLATLALVGNCSATQVSDGSAAIAADPISYLLTLLVLVGPLLLVLAAPGHLTLAPLTARTERWILIISVIGGVGAVLTAYAGFVISFAVLCTSAHPSAAQNAQCVASSGSLASIFGIIGPTTVLPPLFVRMRRHAASRPSGPPQPPS